MNLIVHHIRFTLRARTFIHLGPQAGAQIRGALWEALRGFACAAPLTKRDPEHVQHCPMCWLMALETEQSARGFTPPRPFAIRPPLSPVPGSECQFQSGEVFTVGVNLFGDAADLIPYICQAFYRMGEQGIGYGRGQFTITQVQAVHPLVGSVCNLLQGRRVMLAAAQPVTGAQIEEVAGRLPGDRLTIHFRTPTCLTFQGGRVLDHPHFEALIARLLERCQALELHYTDQPTEQVVWQDRYLQLTQAARDIQLIEDRTRWVRVTSGSRRTDSMNSVSGFAGCATYAGNLTPFREWIVWGASLHVGKNAVKGNGWYDLEN